MTRQASSSRHLIPRVAAVEPALIVFDKDGTLIDFHAMWSAWITELARRLEINTGLRLAKDLFKAMNFDPATDRVIPDGQLALTPLSGLRTLTTDVLRAAGLSWESAETVMGESWFTPDPVNTAVPLADLRDLFATLSSYGIKIAIATSDDRASTEAMVGVLNLSTLVDVMVCADDGLVIKPAPDMILSICHRLEVTCAKTVVVGDNVPDLQMGRAAGAGLVIGVLSGVGNAAGLAPYADFLLPSVGQLFQP
jgi:phosphoglycolate phosphatase-like HAD superfamily hydrolase